MWKSKLARLTVAALLASAAAASISGCGTPSEDGPTLRFRVVHGGPPDYSQIPLRLAQEARVTMRTRDLTQGLAGGTPAPTADVQNVKSSDPSVVEVLSTSSGGQFTIRGASPGDATLTVRADAGKQKMNVKVRTAEQVQFGRLEKCEGPEDTFLAGTEAVLTQTMLDEKGEELRGWGYHPFELRGPVDAKVSDRVRVPERLYLNLMSGAGEVTVQPTVDGAGAPIDVVRPAELDKAELKRAGDEYPKDNHRVAREIYYEPRFVTKSGSYICRGLPKGEVRVKTPSICGVEFRRADTDRVGAGIVEQYQTWHLVVSELKSGTCRYTVDFDAGSIDPLQREHDVDVEN